MSAAVVVGARPAAELPVVAKSVSRAKAFAAAVSHGTRRTGAYAGAAWRGYARGAAPHMGLGANGGNLGAVWHGIKGAAKEVGKLRNADDFVTFYHGTTAKGAASVRAKGIDLSYSRPDLDFGPGFYLTNNRTQDLDWAERAARRVGEEAGLVE